MVETRKEEVEFDILIRSEKKPTQKKTDTHMKDTKSCVIAPTQLSVEITSLEMSLKIFECIFRPFWSLNFGVCNTFLHKSAVFRG